MAQLVDVSVGGLGVETFTPLDRGVEVEVKGVLSRPDLRLRVDAAARVAHSKLTAAGRYRIGLEVIDISLDRVA